jgi:hypothetical protein
MVRKKVMENDTMTTSSKTNKKRFCCWCGKVEYTETCQSQSLRDAVTEVLKNFRLATEKRNDK